MSGILRSINIKDCGFFRVSRKLSSLVLIEQLEDYTQERIDISDGTGGFFGFGFFGFF